MTALDRKARPPALPVPYLPRPHLLTALACGRVVCLTAAPGYGKTSLLSEYAQTENGRFAWYSLDASDRDPAVMLAGLSRGLGGPLWAGESPTLGAAALCRWLETDAVARTVIVDDVQLLAGSEDACRLLGDLLVHTPASVRFILAGRFLPSLPGLARLHLAGQTSSWTEVDLAFSAADSQEVLRRLGARPDDRLHLRSGGWPAALRLMAAMPALDAGGPADLFDYLAHEVLQTLSPADQRFLTAIAVFPAWRAEACDWILGQPGSGAHLARIQHSRLLVTADSDGTLRPHPLWLEFLRGRLQAETPERYRDLQRLAALWEAEHGDVEAALEHALAAGDHGLIERLISRTAGLLIRSGRLQRLEDWLSATPEQVLEAVPSMLVEAGEALRRAGRPSRAVRWLQGAIVGFAGHGPDGLGGLLVALCRLALALGDLGHWSEAEAAIVQVEAELSGAEGAAQAEALLTLAEWHAWLAQPNEAIAGFHAAADAFGQMGLRERQGTALCGLGGQALVSAGQFEQALAVLRQAQERLEGAAACDAILAEFWLCVLLGRWREAYMLTPAMVPGSAHQQAQRSLAEARLAIHRNDLAEAEALYHAADLCLKDAERTPALACAMVQARAWLDLAHRRLDGALIGAREALRLATQARAPLMIALARTLMQEVQPPAAPVPAGGLRAELLGTFRVSIGGRELTADSLGRTQVRGLLQLLLLQPGFGAGREAILEAFWPEESPERSRANLRVSLYRLKKVLAGVGCRLEATPDHIRLAPDTVERVDVAVLRTHLTTVRREGTGSPETCLNLALEGRSLYVGELLPDAYWPWAAAAREQVRREYRELLRLGLEAARRSVRTTEAILILEELLAMEPGQEEAERALMLMLGQSGRRGEVLKRYRRLARWLKTELGIEPAPETKQLVRTLLT